MTLTNFPARILPSLLLTAVATVSQAAPPATAVGPSGMSMDQAVLQVQQRVGGKVLSAEPHNLGRRVEYRIKVLTTDGHVKVLTVPADATRMPPAAQSPKKSPNGGYKERH